METAPRTLRKTPLNAVHRELRRQDGPLRRLGHARRVLGADRRAHGGAQGGRPLRRLPHGRVRGRGPGRPRLPAARHVATTWRSSSDGQAQYSALPMPNGAPVDDVIVYRQARRPLPAGRERRQHREGLRLARGPGARRTATLDDRSDDVRAARAPGARGAGDPAAAHRRSTSPPIAFYHFAEGDGGRASRPRSRAPATRARTASRSSWRPSSARAALARAHGGRARQGPRPRRARRPRHAAARGPDVPLRQRHGRDHDAGRGRPRLDRLAGRGEGRLHRPRGAGGAEEARGRRASWSASR